MSRPFASLPEAITFLLEDARSNGWTPTSWSISELDMRNLREEVGRGDIGEVLGGLPVREAEDDAPMTLHAVRQVTAAEG